MMTHTAQQIQNSRYREAGLRDGTNAERDRCEKIVHSAIASGGSLLTVLSAIEAGEDVESAAVAASAKSATATAGRDVQDEAIDAYLRGAGHVPPPKQTTTDAPAAASLDAQDKVIDAYLRQSHGVG